MYQMFKNSNTCCNFVHPGQRLCPIDFTCINYEHCNSTNIKDSITPSQIGRQDEVIAGYMNEMSNQPNIQLSPRMAYLVMTLLVN